MRPTRLLSYCARLLLGLMLCGVAQAATYTFRSDSFAWESAANTIAWDRSCTTYPGDDDKATITLTGGFTFTFAGTAYNSVRVLSNGGLQFGADTGFFRNYTNTAMPAGNATAYSGCVAGATTNVILGYWTDLNPSQAGSGGVTWEQKGVAPNRYLVVSWNGVYQYNTSTPYTFQIILFENGEFKFQYGNANATGSNATIGVQINNSDYTQYSYNSGYNANGSAIRWFIPSGSPTRLAEYRFEQTSYSGKVGEVIDSSGNNFNGVRAGSATTTASGYVCRGLSVPSNTTSTSNGVDTLLDVNSGIGNAGAVTLWYSAATAWNNSAATLLDATTLASRPFFLVRQSDGSLRASIADTAGTVISAVTPALGVGAGTWKHVAVSWRFAAGSGQSSLRIYVNGVQVGAASGTTNGIVDPSVGTLLVGDNRSSALATNASYNSANGTIDEVRAYNYDISAVELTADMAATHSCVPSLHHLEALPSAFSASTCSPLNITLRACGDAACSVLASNYTGTASLSSSTGRGDWTLGSPTPAGAFSAGAAGSGLASYTFSASDGGTAQLRFAHSLAQNVSLTAADNSLAGSSSTSSAIAFSNNAFVWKEDLSNLVAGSNVVVAGRNHDLQVALWKKDPSTGNCGIATDFTGSRNLKLWRTDANGAWTAPTVVSPALTIPNARPASNNLSLSFTAGVASFNLGTTDVGRYTLNLDDDSLAYASSTISGSIGDLFVRPFTIGVSGLTLAGTGNPSGSLPGDPKFGAAGASFSATVAAYRWSASADSGNVGVPDAGASLAQVSANGTTPGFNATVALSTVAGSQIPATGVLGTLANGTVTGFSGGTVTVGNLAYSEVGAFRLNTSGVVSNYLGALSLDAVVFNASGAQNTLVGRFVPAGFALGNPVITHRVNAACSPASTFSYLGENFQLGFTLTAQNAAGVTTQNYSGAYAKLDPTNPASLGLAGIAGSTMFKSTGASPRLSLISGSGTWSSGVSQNLTLIASVSRSATAVDGPYDTAQFGIAAQDSDNVGMTTLNLDTDSPANGNDATLLGQIPLRWGRLRLQNAIGAATRPLALPVVAQYWNGTAFTTHTLDSCSRITASNLNFGNLRKTLAVSDLVMNPSSLTLSQGSGSISLAAPASGHVGSVDVALSLSSTSTDNSCLKGGWSIAKAATAGANMPFLQGAWCSTAGTAASDPSARATWGLYRGSDGVLYQRENY